MMIDLTKNQDNDPSLKKIHDQIDNLRREYYDKSNSRMSQSFDYFRVMFPPLQGYFKKLSKFHAHRGSVLGDIKDTAELSDKIEMLKTEIGVANDQKDKKFARQLTNILDHCQHAYDSKALTTQNNANALSNENTTYNAKARAKAANNEKSGAKAKFSKVKEKIGAFIKAKVNTAKHYAKALHLVGKFTRKHQVSNQFVEDMNKVFKSRKFK